MNEAGLTTRLSRGHRARPRARVGMALLVILALLTPAVPAMAQEDEITQKVGEVPTTGAARPGPVNAQPPEIARRPGVVPIAIKIEKAQVDAQVEITEIIDGVMQNPTGPWVVSWYQETAKLGDLGNIVMSGHVDYWDVGPAVFWNLRDLQPKDRIEVTGENGKVFTYEVEWVKNYSAADAPIGEIVGQTEVESLTLITCGGEFNYDTGEYLERMIVRATRVQS
jgi:sortase (surface protein transpeptidase)